MICEERRGQRFERFTELWFYRETGPRVWLPPTASHFWHFPSLPSCTEVPPHWSQGSVAVRTCEQDRGELWRSWKSAASEPNQNFYIPSFHSGLQNIKRTQLQNRIKEETDPTKSEDPPETSSVVHGRLVHGSKSSSSSFRFMVVFRDPSP